MYKKFMKIDEKKIQEFWKEKKVFKTDLSDEGKKYYCLDMFPYPSGDGMHVGHIKGYTASDAISKYRKMKGFNVLHPMGWDAFGLPAENFAIKVGKSPKETVKTNIEKFKAQLEQMGLIYDWDLQINTTDPEYYKWTQWIFLKLLEKGLAYEGESPINFCPSCKTGLANEEVIAGSCERCGTDVKKKTMKQWFLKITDYAEKLLEGIDDLDWPEPIKQMQRNWIGRSEGSQIQFNIQNADGDKIANIDVFTTRADTLFGCTYVVIAPENKIIDELKNSISNYDEVSSYIDKSVNKSDLERTDLDKNKTGVMLEGIWAINPINNEKIPVWVADYVLAHYGTGAVMAVPAHDERDFEFAKKYNLPIIKVVQPNSPVDCIRFGYMDQFFNFDLNDEAHNNSARILGQGNAYTGNGRNINSDEFNGMWTNEAKEKITEKLKTSNHGDFTVNYKLRDWVFSRQRYWGEPIPVVHCKNCGTVGVKYEDLPVRLPEVEKYEPTGTGESPLAAIDEWVETTCPKCGGEARRETNTMPQWAGSCWYYLRYLSPNDNESPWDADIEKKFMPVDLYIGGAEHAVLHLLYARFWHKFLYDEELVSTDEPFKKLQNVGLILATDRQKMSKSRGNVVNPDDVVHKYSADALRMYEMFIGPFAQPAIWNTSGIVGVKKFLDKMSSSFDESFKNNFSSNENFELNNLIIEITNKIEKMQFNTAVSSFMKFSNLNDLKKMSLSSWKKFIQILSPFAPHLCETLWLATPESNSVFLSIWPVSEEAVAISNANYVVQINGKKIDTLQTGPDANEDECIKSAISLDKVAEKLLNKEIQKTIFIKGKIINLVIK
jgi:leucyl-tRNA synthetase